MTIIRRVIWTVIILIVIAGCTTPKNDDTIKWIQNNKKPIICVRQASRPFKGDVRYTLYSADGKIYDTEWVTLALPDSILER